MAVTGVANLAVKVADLDEAIGFYVRAGATALDRGPWYGGERVDVRLGALALTLFTRAIYEDEVALPDDGFLHVATFTDDLDREIEGHDVVWGPAVVSGVFGTRRIVFVSAPGNMRLEFMEQLPDPPGSDVGTALARLGTATLGECGATPLAARIARMWRGAALAAPAFTVRCGSADNLAVHAAVAEAPAGSALVVQIEGDGQRGFWGEVRTTGAQARGIVGLVIDGCVRDADALERLGFPVFATGLALRGATKTAPGAIGSSATVGGVPIATNDWIVGDRDGLVAIAERDLARVIEAGQEREANEAEMFTALRGGSTTVQLLGLDTSQTVRG